MTEKNSVRFEEAERHKGVILTAISIVCVLITWLVRYYSVLLGFVSILSIYLLTGDRYQWVYIWKKTFYRDMIHISNTYQSVQTLDEQFDPHEGVVKKLAIFPPHRRTSMITLLKEVSGWTLVSLSSLGVIFFSGLRVLLITMLTIWIWERRGITVVTRWAEVARKTPNKIAFVMGDRSLTFREGDEFSNRVAWYFKRQGFKKGEVIALFMETQPEYVFLWLGLAKVRVTTALVNTSLRGEQLIHCLRIVGCKAVVFGDEMANEIKAIRSEISDIPLFQFNSPERQLVPIVQDATPVAAELNEMSSDSFHDVEPAQPRDTLLYIYTSGTTGFPKAAIITNIRYLLIPLGVHTSGRLTISDTIYDPLPLHHTAGGVLGAGQCVIMGCTVALRNKFSASNYWNDVAKYGCTAAQYIGEICRYLLKIPPGPSDRAHSVRVMIGNGLRPQIWQDFIDRFGIKHVLEFYGATEGNSNLVNLDSKVGAIGFLSRLVASIYPLTLIKCDEVTGEILRNEYGRCISCGPYEPGLLLGKIDPKKAILTFAGYADKTESEKKMVRNVRVKGDCYFNTGDILVMDHYGYFYFKDRTGDTFRWRGENVSTAEIEGVISSLIGLKDAVVYGVTIPNVEGKAGMAAIADLEHKLDLISLAKGLNSSLPVYARPLFIRILPETPLTATFKLKKKELMDQGFNINLHNDPIFFLDPKLGSYVPLTHKLYDDLVQGVIRL